MSPRYVPLAELRRIRGLDAEPHDRAAAFADACRLNALYMIARAGSGHIGTTFSCMPWLRGIDGARLGELAPGAPIICLDNHYPVGGQGDGVLAALAAAGHPAAALVHKLAVETVPACGSNDEVLRPHRLDAPGVAAAIMTALGEPG